MPERRDCPAPVWHRRPSSLRSGEHLAIGKLLPAEDLPFRLKPILKIVAFLAAALHIQLIGTDGDLAPRIPIDFRDFRRGRKSGGFDWTRVVARSSTLDPTLAGATVAVFEPRGTLGLKVKPFNVDPQSKAWNWLNFFYMSGAYVNTHAQSGAEAALGLRF